MYRYDRGSSNYTGLRSDEPISNEVIRQVAPSVLADSAHSSRGERYTFIPTAQVLDGLRAEGWAPYEVRQTKVRDHSKVEHTKHLLRLRHQSHAVKCSDYTPELVLLNSHDGTSSYKLLSGFFRFVCANGLIAGDIVQDVSVRHSGRVVADVIEGSYRVLENIRIAGERINQYKGIHLNERECEVFGDAALSLRWPEGAPVTPEQVVHPRRVADANPDLWSVFNVVQENILRGGLPGKSQTNRRIRTRTVRAIDQDVRLNAGLWSLADWIADLKAGGSTIERIETLEAA